MSSVKNEYWEYGLHDSVITDIKWGETKPNNKNHRLNYLKFFLDTDNSLGETNIKEITFYNYSASWKGGTIKNFSFYVGTWWISDCLTKKDNQYHLVLELEYPDKPAYENRETITVEFEQLEVTKESF